MLEITFGKISQIIIAALCMLTLSGLIATGLSTTPVAADTRGTVKEGVTGVGGGEAGNDGNQVKEVIKNVIGILSFLVGLVAVLMIVIAGFRFVTSNGDSNNVSSAKNTIIYAVIGIVVTVMAYAIVNFIIDNI